MKRMPFAGGWYADVTPGGDYAVLHPSSHIETSRGRVELPTGGDVLFLVCAVWGGVLVLGGQGHDDGQGWLWNGTVWRAVCPTTYGTSPCAFGPLGFYVSMPGVSDNVAVFDPITFGKRVPITQPIGARGIALVSEDGVIHGQDDWYGQFGLAEYVEIGTLRIGQGVTGGCVAADHGELEPGSVQFVRVHQQADRLGVAMWKDAEKQAVCLTLTVDELPTPERPPMLGRFWLAPNIGSLDELDLLADVSQLAGVEVVSLYVQQILTDTSTPQLGQNIYPALVKHDVFRTLNAAGIPLVIEMGSVKPGDCDAKGAIGGMQTAVQRVHDAGGVVAAFAMDEPLTSNQQACGGNIGSAAAAVATFIQSVQTLGPIAVGWIEAWPEVGFNTMRLFLIELRNRNTVPAFLHLDIDWNRAKHEGKDPVAFINAAKGLATEFGLTLGLYVNATKDPIATDAEHYQNLDALAQKIHGIAPDAAHVVTCSWAHRVSPDPTHATQNVPNNLGANGLLASLTNTRALFGAAVPEPEPETDMLSILTDPLKEVIAVAVVKPVAGSKAVTWILPNGSVYSCQPGGAYGERPAGTEGPWEKNRTAGNMGTFLVEGKYYTKAFVVVDGL